MRLAISGDCVTYGEVAKRSSLHNPLQQQRWPLGGRGASDLALVVGQPSEILSALPHPGHVRGILRSVHFQTPAPTRPPPPVSCLARVMARLERLHIPSGPSDGWMDGWI